MVLINRDDPTTATTVTQNSRKRLRDTVASWLPPPTPAHMQPGSTSAPAVETARPERLGAGAEAPEVGKGDAEDVKRRLVGRGRKDNSDGPRRQATRDGTEQDEGEEEEEGSKVALIERRRRLKEAQSAVQQQQALEQSKEKRKRKKKKKRLESNVVQSANQLRSEQREDGSEAKQPPQEPHQTAEYKQSATESAPIRTAELPPTTADSAMGQQPPRLKKTRQGQAQQFVPFVRGKVKRKAKRSRQKNIRKDNRPDHLKPNYLTVLPRPNRTAAQADKQPQSHKQQTNSVADSGNKTTR